METIETLQNGSDSGARSQGPSSIGSQHSLIKRIVELTAELSSQMASTGMAERKVLDLEADRLKKAKLCNSLRAQLQNSLHSVEALQTQYKVLTSQLMETEKARHEERLESRLENEQLSHSLKDAEATIQSMEITLEELKTQAKLNEETDFQKWLDSIILHDEKALLETLNKDKNSLFESVFPKESSFPSSSSYEDREAAAAAAAVAASGNIINNNQNQKGSVYELVSSLLEQWHHEHPHHLSMNKQHTLPGNNMSKSEQKFLQKISDLVTDAHERLTINFITQ